MTQDIKNAILGVKNGRYECFDVIRSKYEPLIVGMAQSFEKSGAGSTGDLSEEAERALLKAVLSFDETKDGITFGLYAKICIRNALISVRRARLSRDKRERSRKAERRVRLERRGKTVFEGLDAAEIMDFMKSLLSPYEYFVLSEYMRGNSIGEIADGTGRSERSVNNALYRIRRKAKEASRAASKQISDDEII